MKKPGANECQEIAPDVYFLEVGRGISRANVYFVRSGSSWVLIDAASAKCARLIRQAAESLFGGDSQPSSILLTHDHPDHAGSALELARSWNCTVYVHPDELPIAAHGDLPTFEKFANPLDRWVVLPIMRLMPRRRLELMLEKTSLKGVVKAFDPDASVPGLPDWKCIPTSGHTPGQVAFFRASDRVLISGDAFVTADLNSFWGLLLWSLRLNQQKISGPPLYSTWKKPEAKAAVIALAELEPRVLATGHGPPMSGDKVARELYAFANRFAGR